MVFFPTVQVFARKPTEKNEAGVHMLITNMIGTKAGVCVSGEK